MLEVLKRQNVDASVWNLAVETMDTAWAWHNADFIAARSTWAETQDESFAIVDQGNTVEILALVPLMYVKSRRIPAVLSGYLESTGGPAINPDLPRRTQSKVLNLIQEALQDISQRTGARRLDMSAPPLAPVHLQARRPMPNPFCFYGAVDSSTQSWILHLTGQDEDTLWQNLEHRSRKEIKKARRHDLVVTPCTPDAALLEKYYSLHLETCVRNGIPPHPKAYFEIIFHRIGQNGMSRCYVVRQGDEILSILNFLIYKNAALYWTTACQAKALTMSANDLGFWSAILDLKAMEIQAIECGEAFPGARSGKMKGLNDFKKSFGGTLYPYFRGQIIFRPVLESCIAIARTLLKRDGK